MRIPLTELTEFTEKENYDGRDQSVLVRTRNTAISDKDPMDLGVYCLFSLLKIGSFSISPESWNP